MLISTKHAIEAEGDMNVCAKFTAIKTFHAKTVRPYHDTRRKQGDPFAGDPFHTTVVVILVI